MRKFTSRWARSAAALIVCMSGQAMPAAAQSLDEALLAAFANNPDMRIAEAGISSARAGVQSARSAYRPQVTFQSSLSASRRDARLRDGADFSESSEPLSATLRAEQPLFTNGLRRIATNQSVLALRQQRLGHEASRQALAITTANSLLEMVQADDVLQIQIETERLIATQITAESERLRLGTGTRTNLAQVEARLASARAAIANARGELASSRARFEIFTGIHPSQPAWPETSFERPQNPDEARFFARDASPQLAAARLGHDQARLGVAAATRQFGPQLGLSLEATRSREPSPAIDRDDDLRATLSFSLPLFTGGRSTAERRAALAERSARLAEIKLQENALSQQVLDAWYRLEAVEAELVAIAAQIAAAEDTLEGVERGRNAGLWTVTDVLDATERLNAARLSEVQARTVRHSAEFELAILTGLYDLPDV